MNGYEHGGEGCWALWAGAAGGDDSGGGRPRGQGSGEAYGRGSGCGRRVSCGRVGGYARVGQADGIAGGIAAARCGERAGRGGAVLCGGTRLRGYGNRFDGGEIG